MVADFNMTNNGCFSTHSIQPCLFCEVNQISFDFLPSFLLQITQSSLASPDLPTDRVTAHMTTTSDHVTMTTDHMTATSYL